jgi:hypothetical protein
VVVDYADQPKVDGMVKAALHGLGFKSPDIARAVAHCKGDTAEERVKDALRLLREGIASTADQPKPSETKTATEAKPSKSTIESPTKAVWHIADEMHKANPNVARKTVIEECVRRGIAFYTARTQYQRWATNRQA